MLLLHICGGTVGMLSGFAAMAFRKGFRWHIRNVLVVHLVNIEQNESRNIADPASTSILVMALDTKCHNDLQPGIMVLCPRWRQKIWEPTTAHRSGSTNVLRCYAAVETGESAI